MTANGPVDLQAMVRVINELLILAVLRDEAKHGYQIALDVERATEGAFAFQHGTLYPILHRLESEGRIEGSWDTGEGRRRKVYALRRSGRSYLEEESARVEGVFEAFRGLVGGAG